MYSKQSQLQSTKKKKPKTVTRKGLVRQLDDLVRKILHTYPDKCVCCGKENLGWWHPQDNPRGLQSGHFISRTRYAYRWDLRQVWPQCSGCNYNHNNDPAAYSLFLVEKYGIELIRELAFGEKRIQKVTTAQMRDLVVELQGKLEEITS